MIKRQSPRQMLLKSIQLKIQDFMTNMNFAVILRIMNVLMTKTAYFFKKIPANFSMKRKKTDSFIVNLSCRT